MNSTNILLGSTGMLLVIALLFSYTKMNERKSSAAPQIAALEREIELLDEEQRQLRAQAQAPGTVIFSDPLYRSAPIEPVAEEKDETAERMRELEIKMQEMADSNRDLQDQLASANQPDPEPVIENEPVIEPEVAAVDPKSERRARLIRNALLQGTVLAWDPEYWTISLDPTARANFNIGDELALRRNDGILCRFVVERQVEDQFIAVLKSNLAGGAPEVVPNDELIIPPAYDGIPD